MTDFAVDLNADVGESFGAFTVGDDSAVMESVTSVNVAAGFHGGDPRTMERVVHAAKMSAIGVGAHPGFPDLVGFGRRDMKLSPDEVRTDTLYQIGAVAAFTRIAGMELQHVKPHGQLNNMAVRDRAMAEAIVTAVQAFDPRLILVSYGGHLTRAAEAAGLAVAHEVYADREYDRDGNLVSRSVEGAVLHDAGQITKRALRMITHGMVAAISGEIIDVRVDTICIHADTSGAAAIAKSLKSALLDGGISLKPMAEVISTRN